MKRGSIKVETDGSFWFIDETEQKYLRMPKWEGPRERAEWGNTPGALQDLVWHDYLSWEVDNGRLRIFVDAYGWHVSAPDPVVHGPVR